MKTVAGTLSGVVLEVCWLSRVESGEGMKASVLNPFSAAGGE
jgi:hypothetical protein